MNNNSLNRIKALYDKYKEVVHYGVFGVLTTLINIIVYWFFAHLLDVRTVPSSVIAWVAAVAFAFFTNRKWVFYSQANSVGLIIKEAISFFGCRLATGFFDWAYMYLTVDIIGLNDVWMKVIANIIVIILNYIASKFYIFKH